MYQVNCELTDEEMGSIIQAVNTYVYESAYMTDEKYEIVMSALEKITQDVI